MLSLLMYCSQCVFMFTVDNYNVRSKCAESVDVRVGLLEMAGREDVVIWATCVPSLIKIYSIVWFVSRVRTEGGTDKLTETGVPNKYFRELVA